MKQRTSHHHFLFFGLTSFHSLPQREQAIAMECAALGHRVDFIEIAPSVAGKTHALINRAFSPLARDTGFSRSNRLPNLHIHTPPTLPTGFRNSLTPGVDRTVFRHWFRKTFAATDFSDVIAMVMIPIWWGNFIDRALFDPKLLIYDICDALEVQSRNGRTLERLRASERLLAAEADIITYSAREMQEDIERRFAGVDTLFLPNAVSRDFIARFDREPLFYRNGNPPQLGYIGATNGKWFDAELVHATIREFPECDIAIIGPVDKAFAERCAAFDNVTLHGYVHHHDLPRYLRGFDVALIPFLHNSITSVVNPLKLYEYSSAGLPVVATWTEELQHHESMVYLGRSREDFFAGIRRALSESDDERRIARRRFAEENTWEERVHTLLRHLRKQAAVV